MNTIQANNKSTPHIKRFLEQYVGDSSFRESLTSNKPVSHSSIKNIHHEDIRCLWDASLVPSDSTGVDIPIKDFREFNQQKADWRGFVRKSCSPKHSRFSLWRQRQMNRCNLELGTYLNERLIHSPIMFELSEGCSVGCSFCAFKAKKLSDIFAYTKENAALWQDILLTIHDLLGESAKWGTCYFATDPLDNPDYEHFCLDYARIVGAFPQTTTALALKDIERTKKIIKLSRKHGNEIDRFSVLSLKKLYKIFDAFSPEELTYVELMLQNKESLLLKSYSGKYSEQVDRDPKLTSQKNIMSKSISCLTGFLVNMCTKTCRLIASCPASPEWPLGYMVFAEESFQSSSDFKRVLHHLIDTYMTTDVHEQDYLQLGSSFDLHTADDHFELRNAYQAVRLSFQEEHRPYMETLLHYLQHQTYSAETIAMLLYYGYQVSEDQTYNTLQRFYEQGLMKEMTIYEPRS